MTDYSELVKALRCGNDGKLPCDNKECPYWVDQWHGIGLCNIIKKQSDAADAIEALQAQLPKRGEWVGVSPMVDTVQCSVCEGQLFSAELETPYCPYCGAKMNDSNASNASNALNALDNAHDGLIVRCRECKHYNAGFECLAEGYGIERDPDWFCADGERKVQE